jgi:integrase/recombinase XerD
MTPQSLWSFARESLRLPPISGTILFGPAIRIQREFAFHSGTRFDPVDYSREIDFDNLLVTLDGKGRKQRIVPFSFELRKALFRYIAEFNRKPDSLLLASRNETQLARRVMLRDVKMLCKHLGFNPPARTLHAFRHTFAVNYLRRGGSVFHLQKVLGHSTLEMTRRYANLVTADLQAIHERVSLLTS